MSTPFRRRVELRAGPAVVLLGRLPKVVPFLVVLVLLVAGLLVKGPVGALLLGVLVLLLSLITFLAWPALQPQGRVIRVVVLALVIGQAVLFLV